MNHRSATVKDFSNIIAIQKNDGFPHQYYLTDQRLKRLFTRGETFYIVEEFGKSVGFGSVDCEVRAQIHFICVDKKFSKKGVGRKLIQLCLAEAKRKGCQRACSYVEANSNKETFLVKMGFQQVGFYKNRYGNGTDASIWEIDIK